MARNEKSCGRVAKYSALYDTNERFRWFKCSLDNSLEFISLLHERVFPTSTRRNCIKSKVTAAARAAQETREPPWKNSHPVKKWQNVTLFRSDTAREIFLPSGTYYSGLRNASFLSVDASSQGSLATMLRRPTSCASKLIRPVVGERRERETAEFAVLGKPWSLVRCTRSARSNFIMKVSPAKLRLSKSPE